jgi:adenosylcobinamide-phosphate synthase
MSDEYFYLALPVAALALGFALDMLAGDPKSFPHIVRVIGRLITLVEGVLYKDSTANNTNKRIVLVTKGAVFACIVLGVCTASSCFILYIGYKIHPLVGFLLEAFFIYQAIAVKDLRTESMRVYTALKEGRLDSAKAALSMIVGRDTEGLDEAGVARAAVETVAENSSDGAAAPLFYIAFGGAAAGIFYKAANTMDSMVGYKNDRYIYFGRAAAKIDDALNYLPSRLCALLMIAAAASLRFDWEGAARIWKRDRHKHASPNAAQTEAACAGALGLRLAGPAYYEGHLEEKPYIGDDERAIEAEDIVRANALHIRASLFMFVIALGARLCCMAAIYILTKG